MLSAVILKPHQALICAPRESPLCPPSDRLLSYVTSLRMGPLAYGSRGPEDPRNNPSYKCSVAALVWPYLAARGLRAAVWTTMTSGKPVILVVEDEALVRMLAVSVAEDSGFGALSPAPAHGV